MKYETKTKEEIGYEEMKEEMVCKDCNADICEGCQECDCAGCDPTCMVYAASFRIEVSA